MFAMMMVLKQLVEGEMRGLFVIGLVVVEYVMWVTAE